MQEIRAYPLEDTVVQTYLHINDITPSEAYWEEVDDKCYPPSYFTREQLYQDIKKHGLCFQLKVDRFGNVINGNMRYWTCLRLFLEGDTRFEFLPVEFNFYAGFFPLDQFDNAFKINLTLGIADNEKAEQLREYLIKAKITSQPVIKRKELKDYDIPMDKVGGYLVAWRVNQVMMADPDAGKRFNTGEQEEIVRIAQEKAAKIKGKATRAKRLFGRN